MAKRERVKGQDLEIACEEHGARKVALTQSPSICDPTRHLFWGYDCMLSHSLAYLFLMHK